MATKAKAPAAPPPLPTIADVASAIREKFIEKAAEQVDAQDARVVVREIVKDLNNAKQQATATLLGLRNTYGPTEFDHCNGRMGAIDQMLTEIAKPILTDWVREAFEEFKASPAFGDLRNKTKAAIVKNVKEQALNYRHINSAAENLTNGILNTVTKELRAELNLP